MLPLEHLLNTGIMVLNEDSGYHNKSFQSTSSSTVGSANNPYPSFPIFNGLQRPLEFMGLQGRYIYWGAATIASAILGFILGYCLIGFIAALIILVIAVCSGAALILLKQKNGLHTKKVRKGLFIYHRLKSL